MRSFDSCPLPASGVYQSQILHSALAMVPYIEIGLLLLAAIAALGVAANRLRLPPSILLVLAGTALAMVPGLPRIELVPELILLLVLPPVIYSAGVSMSWREFRFNLRPITLLAIGAVVFTTCAVAAGLHWLLGWPWLLIGWLSFLPDWMFNWIYRLIASNRQAFFPNTQCVVPPHDQKDRFLP